MNTSGLTVPLHLQLSQACEGTYTFILIDEDGMEAQVTFDLLAGGAPYEVVENITLNCTGGPNLTDCSLFLFPGDSLGGGEACIVEPPCWSAPYVYEWTYNGAFISNSGCAEGLIPGAYSVTIIDQNNETASFDFVMEADGENIMMSESICVTSVDESALSQDFSLHPNPTAYTLYIRNADEHIGAQYEIYNLVGNVMLTGQINTAQSAVELDRLSDGTYIIRLLLTDGQKTASKRFIVLR